LPIWANFRQRALDTAIAEINKKTDLRIKLSSIERSKHRRVVALIFSIKAQAIPKRWLWALKKDSATPARVPAFLEPMKAKLVDSIPHGDWIYEINFDGYRAIAMRGGSE
jgi:ATP-dependent DNA ligase